LPQISIEARTVMVCQISLVGMLTVLQGEWSNVASLLGQAQRLLQGRLVELHAIRPQH